MSTELVQAEFQCSPFHRWLPQFPFLCCKWSKSTRYSS